MGVGARRGDAAGSPLAGRERSRWEIPGRNRNPRSRLSRWALNAGLIIFSLMVVLGGLEIALRFTSYRYLLTRDRHLRYYYQFDPVKGFDINPNVKGKRLSVDNRVEFEIWSNELGCFDEPYHGEKRLHPAGGRQFYPQLCPLPG